MLRQAGILLGQMKNKDFIPLPELAFSQHINQSVSKFELH